jgi:hypothetical protein
MPENAAAPAPNRLRNLLREMEREPLLFSFMSFLSAFLIQGPLSLLIV